MKSDENLSSGWRKLSKYGLGVSLLYLAVIGSLSLENRALFNDLKADGWATFVSGIFSPLAFLWLVLGFFQQGHELRQSAEALRLQGDELRNSVEQQKALVDLNKEQLEHEKNERFKAEQEMERAAQPKIGIQHNGSTSSSGAQTFEFLLANAGAMVTNVRLMEGTRSAGETATWAPGTGLSVVFSFESGEVISSRILSIFFTDGRGRSSSLEVTFPALDRSGRMTLLAPNMV